MRLLALMLVLVAMPVLAIDPNDPILKDPNFCGEPPRDARNEIIRSSKVKRDFEAIYPRSRLPTQLFLRQDGTPEPWFLDHKLPMACGGCDSVGNLQWLPERLWRAKSKLERIVYGGRGISPGCP